MSESCSQDNEKYSAENEFTVSFGDTDHVAACDYVGIASGNNTPDKLERAGFTTVKSECVDAPLSMSFLWFWNVNLSDLPKKEM